MTPNQPRHSTPDADPRLLLPDWLRDESPPSEPVRSPDPSPQGDSERGGRAPEPDRPASAWQQPPAPVERYDPSTLIAPEDLPEWIRALSLPHESPSTSPTATIPVPPVETAPDEVPVERGGNALTTSDSKDVTGLTEPQPTVSDLTETRFVLLAGAALIVILAVLALFYL